MRFIDADALKRKYEEQAAIEYNKHVAPASWSSAFETVADDIEMAVIDYGWISVKDQLPENGKRYIIYATSADGQDHHISIASFGGHFHLSGRRTYWKVTHWMPLPEAPKDVDEDD